VKVALLFFGQLRHIDNPHTSNSHHQMIIDRYDTDVFAHCWWAEGDQYNTSGHVTDLRIESANNSLDKFKSKYNFTSLECEPSRTFTHQAESMITRTEDHMWSIPKPYWFLRDNAMSNTFSHMYSIQKVGDLLAEHIKSTNTNYDFIILSRPDICIWQYPDLRSLSPNNFYLSNHHDRFPDLQFIFGPKFLNFLKVYDHISDITDSELYSLHEPNGENFKASCFQKYHNTSDLRPIPLPVRIVRGDECKGLQW
jgi:hypothetical protein